ncbi:MAG TPA: tetratricopeptide repeat protein, partial [Myxococcaceae bacterium]|nr:tetratricopeptide repeat protein [Myxococcaceae bacterium]
MTAKRALGAFLALGIGATPLPGQIAGKWVEQKCGLKPGHFQVNSGVLYLRKAVETRFEEERKKQLADAERVLLQAVTTGGQQENPAAWYYLGRYYALREDGTGADSAFSRAQRIRAECAEDISFWRQQLWVPVFNAGVAAYQAGNMDSAIASFTRATAINPDDATGPFYVGVFHANAEQSDSAIKYFRIAIERAGDDTAYTDDKRQAYFNIARMYHRAQRWDEAKKAYQEYLTAYPGDAEATAALASAYTATGMRDSANQLYRAVLDRADSVAFLDLFQAGVAIFRGAPPVPDTAAAAAQCRQGPGLAGGTTPAARRRCAAAKVDSVMQEHRKASRAIYELASRAFAAVLKKNPYYRDALYNLANTYYQLRDTANFLPVAQQLIKVDPMNRTSNLLIAQAYQMKAKGDSALYYLQVSDSVLPAEVNITELSLNEKNVAVGGMISNFHEKPSQPLTITFEFLNEK